MTPTLALCTVVSLTLGGAALAQSGEREPARTPASASAQQDGSARCESLTGAERAQCLRTEAAKTERKPRRADEHSGGGSSAPGGRADGQPGSYGARAPAKSRD